MTSDQDRQRAENNFKQRERHRRKALVEYEIQALATREKIARLKTLRLANEAESQKFNKAK
jgi:hypothetical protein